MDGFRRIYGDMAREQGMTLEQMQEKNEKVCDDLLVWFCLLMKTLIGRKKHYSRFYCWFRLIFSLLIFSLVKANFHFIGLLWRFETELRLLTITLLDGFFPMCRTRRYLQTTLAWFNVCLTCTDLKSLRFVHAFCGVFFSFVFFFLILHLQLGTFNGDPHPGNIWLMDNECLGLIDYGQVKNLTPPQIRSIAKIVLAVAADDSEAIIREFTKAGFKTENMNPWIIERTARVYFEDDTKPELLTRLDGSKMNFQQVFEYLNKVDKTLNLPDFLFLPVRCALLIRGLASHFGMGVNVAERWK